MSGRNSEPLTERELQEIRERAALPDYGIVQALHTGCLLRELSRLQSQEREGRRLLNSVSDEWMVGTISMETLECIQAFLTEPTGEKKI